VAEHPWDKAVLGWCRDVVAQVSAHEPAMQSLDDSELQALTRSFRARLEAGETLTGLLPEAFAAVREAAVRTLDQRHSDVQIMGGAVLHLGKIAEMGTGEGKTLTATLPAYLNALTGAGVHLLTANDDLARRNAEWLGPMYRFLGMQAGLLQPGHDPEVGPRRAAYEADVTYGNWQEFGYDHLRDNLSRNAEDVVQQGNHLAIVDEADLILLNEATTPMLISGPGDQVLARVQVWDYLRQYQRLCGVTGSARTEAQVYRQVYRLDVVTIPGNRQSVRGRWARFVSGSPGRSPADPAASPAEWLELLLPFYAVLADQQHVIYAERRAVLAREGLPERIRGTIDEVIRAQVTAAGRQRVDTDQLWRDLRRLFPVTVTPEALASQCGCDVAGLPPEFVAEQAAADAQRAYDRREAELGAQVMRELERQLSLAIIDSHWRDHLRAMEELLEASRARARGGVDPLPEYQREAAFLFKAMRAAASTETVRTLFTIELEITGEPS
jgi:preprotein translocase subunit SecA